jgi:hypothetical protein
MLRFFSPRWLVTISFSIWLLLALVSPISYEIEPSLMAILVLASYAVFFFAGTLAYRGIVTCCGPEGTVTAVPLDRDSSCRQLSGVRLRRVFMILLIIATVGLALRYYDLFAIKSYLSFASASDFKINYDESLTSYGLSSVVSAVMAPFAVALFCFTARFKERIPFSFRVMALLLLGAFIAYIVLRGGRTAITLILIVYLTSLALSGRLDRPKMSWSLLRRVSLAALVSGVFFYYSLALLVGRLEVFGLTVVPALDYMEAAHHLALSGPVIELASTSQFVGAVVYTAISLVHYFVHGYYQFFLLFDTFEFQNMTYGAAQFYPFVKMLNVMGFNAVTSVHLLEIVEEPGVYTTFFGPVYMDFGYFGFAYCFVLGFFCELSWYRARMGSLFHFMVYPFLASVLFHSSFLNMIQSGMGLYLLVALIAAGYILKLSSGRPQRHSLSIGRESS